MRKRKNKGDKSRAGRGGDKIGVGRGGEELSTNANKVTLYDHRDVCTSSRPRSKACPPLMLLYDTYVGSTELDRPKSLSAEYCTVPWKGSD
jgi:hypothetical protein